MDEEIENFLKEMADNYVSQISDDPEENECQDCGMSEKLHEVMPHFTCGNFKDGRDSK